MAEALNPAASHHPPPFITAPGHTDVLMVITGLFLVLFVLGVGILFLRLHHLPEHLAHKSQKLQYEIVAVLGLLAMFTHIHLFWVAALLLSLIDFPDFGGQLGRIARSLEKMARITRPDARVAESEQRTGTVPVDLIGSDSGGAMSEEMMVAQGRSAEVSTLKPSRAGI